MKPVTLRVQGIGPVPAKKNSKLLTHGRLVTKPEYQKWMKKCEDAFVSQLTSIIPTEGVAMRMVPPPLSEILSSLPEDDCWEQVEWGHIRGHLASDPSEVGAVITIERL